MIPSKAVYALRSCLIVVALLNTQCGWLSGLLSPLTGDAGRVDARSDVPPHDLGPTADTAVDMAFTAALHTETMGNDPARMADDAIANAAAAFQSHAAAIDLNGDGVPEWQIVWGSDGVALLETLDVNGDGYVDHVWDRRQATHWYLIDRNYDRHFEDRRSSVTSRVAPGGYDFDWVRDEDGDGITDHEMVFTIDPADEQMVIQHTWDRNHDGRWDREPTGTTTVDRDQAMNPVEPDTGRTCDGDQAAIIQAAFASMQRRATACLQRVDHNLAEEFAKLVAGTNHIHVQCATPMHDGTSPCGNSPGLDLGENWHTSQSVTIQLSPMTASTGGDPNCMDDIFAVLFHELMHNLLGPHEHGDGKNDPGDRVYGCQRLCFNSPANVTQFECTQCLGTTIASVATDPRCQPFPPHVCDSALEPPVTCSSTGQQFSLGSGCRANCTGGMDPQCDRRGPCR